MYRLVTLVVLCLMYISACSSPDPRPILPAPSPLEKVIIAFQAEVKLDPSLRWTPTFFAPVFVELRSVTLVEQWPLNGDEVDVICRDSNGGEVLDPNTDKFTTEWYRIRAPKDKVDPELLDATGPRATEIEGGYSVYIQGFYLQVPEGKVAPACF